MATVGPAHVADADKEGCGQAVRRADLHPQQRRLAAEAHGPDAQFVRRLEDVLFQVVQHGIRVAVFDRAEELLLAEFVARGAVTADAHAEDARAAALALRLQHGIEDDLAAAIQITIGLQLLVRQGVLRAHVLATATLEHEGDFDLAGTMLVKMDGRRTGPHVCAIILAGDGVHRVLAEITLLRGRRHGLPGRFLKRDLVETDGAIYVKDDAAGILADGLGFLFRQLDVLLDDLESRLGDRALLLILKGRQNGFLHVIRYLGRRTAYQLDQ